MIIGIDVSKAELVYASRDGAVHAVANSTAGIATFLKHCPKDTTLAMEATGRYHRLVADTAHARGFRVLVLNPKDVSQYARSVSPRAATDPIAAQRIAEFAELRTHRSYQPAPKASESLKTLLRTRAGLVKQRIQLENQIAACADVARVLRKAQKSITASITELDAQIAQRAKALPPYAVLLGIPGVGPVIAAYLLALLLSGSFRSGDSFVAFVGLDLRVRDSGTLRGRRRLSKRGDPEARRLLYLAAMTACRITGPFKELYEHYLSKGFSKTEATVFVARKLARTAWSIYTHGTPYTPERVRTHAQPSAEPVQAIATLSPEAGATEPAAFAAHPKIFIGQEAPPLDRTT